MIESALCDIYQGFVFVLLLKKVQQKRYSRNLSTVIKQPFSKSNNSRTRWEPKLNFGSCIYHTKVHILSKFNCFSSWHTWRNIKSKICIEIVKKCKFLTLGVCYQHTKHNNCLLMQPSHRQWGILHNYKLPNVNFTKKWVAAIGKDDPEVNFVQLQRPTESSVLPLALCI